MSQKWVHPSHFCRFVSISFHRTTFKKCHFDTMNSNLCTTYITASICCSLKTFQNTAINVWTCTHKSEYTPGWNPIESVWEEAVLARNVTKWKGIKRELIFVRFILALHWTFTFWVCTRLKEMCVRFDWNPMESVMICVISRSTCWHACFFRCNSAFQCCWHSCSPKPRQSHYHAWSYRSDTFFVKLTWLPWHILDTI